MNIRIVCSATSTIIRPLSDIRCNEGQNASRFAWQFAARTAKHLAPGGTAQLGIPLPLGAGDVCYAWLDTLINYPTGGNYLSDSPRFSHLWPQAIRLIGKDILTTLGVYWPTVLHALGLTRLKAIVAHGWWVIGGAKISKSRAKMQPLDLANVDGADAFRCFLARDEAIDQDAEFRRGWLENCYQADLENDLGNLLHCVQTMIGCDCAGHVPMPGEAGAEEDALRVRCLDAVRTALEHIDALTLN